MSRHPEIAPSGGSGWLAGQTSFGLFVALISALTLIRIVTLNLNATDLYMDEAQYWAWSRELAFGYYSKPGLLAWIISGATSLCGDGEVCVRLPSALIHMATSLVVYAVAARLYGAETAFVAALAYATLPGISFSSQIISTDVPLLFFWAVALLAFVELVQRKSVAAALLLGVAVGLGLNAKYAMAYFAVSALITFVLLPSALRGLDWRHVLACLGPALLLITPNLVWNANHDFATLSHTADNANWSGALFRPEKALEFVGAQFGVFGPIMFGTLIAVVWRTLRGRQELGESDRMLLAFALPIIVIVTVQAFISRAHANWAAPAYVAASIVIPAIMLREKAVGWLKASFVVSLVIMLGLGFATTFAGRFTLPNGQDPYARTLGNEELAAAVRGELERAVAAKAPYGAIVAESRNQTAGLLYYGRDLPVPIFAWHDGGRPRNHFELTRAYRKGAPEPVLVVTTSDRPAESLVKQFDRVSFIGSREIAAGETARRTVYFFSCQGFRGH